MKIQFLGSHTITLPVIQASSTQKQEMHERPGNQHQRQTQPDLCPGCVPVWRQCPNLAAPWRKHQTHNSIPASYSSSPSHLCRCQIAWGVHNNNQQFLQYDNGQNAENRMLVFYSPESLERLANAQTFFIFMDGTISVPPHPFKQLYTIRVPFKDVTGTAIYAFLPNKCQDTYRELFQSIV